MIVLEIVLDLAAWKTISPNKASPNVPMQVGIVGTKFLFPTLVEAGRGDVALMVAQVKTAPGYVYSE